MSETEDEMDASKAPLIEHLTELRTRLIHSLIGLGVTMVICFIFAKQIFDILTGPLHNALVDRGMEPRLIYTALQEKFFTDLRIAMFGGVFLAFPIIAMQVWKFVAPGLYKNEQNAFWPFLVATPLLFILGSCLVYFFVAPMAFGFFLDYGTTTGIDDGVATSTEFLGKVREYLDIMMTFLLAFGICFQLPVLLTLMGRAGLVSGDGLARTRKYAVVAIAAAAAILTPPDPLSQLGLAIPVYALYEISIFLVRMSERKRARQEAEWEDEDDDEPEAEDDEAHAEAESKS
ncbi:MAG: twin-arginine translocase subunit TatC [Rhodobacteraceae bacterium]|nr:twin-arginine translocase subunit TatC [Paracoccaceae bacterium]MBR28870.1 twin-arginine translocase subunit TatC [Paracoccaceae bacterium]